MELLTHHQLTSALTNLRSLERSDALLVAAVASQATAKLDVLAHVLDAYMVVGGNGERLYEALLQTYLFAGFPATIEALRIASARGIQLPHSRFEPYNVEEFHTRGRQCFSLVYGELSSRVHSQIESLSQELAEWILIEGYGKVLSRPSPLGILDRERLAIAALAAGGWQRQLRAHLRAFAQLGGRPDDAFDTLSIAATLGSNDQPIESEQLIDYAWQSS